MFKVTVTGSADVLSVVPSFDEALAVMHPFLGNPSANGNISKTDTGEVLVVLENGEIPFIAPDTIVEMLDAIFEADPAAGLLLALGALATLE